MIKLRMFLPSFPDLFRNRGGFTVLPGRGLLPTLLLLRPSYMKHGPELQRNPEWLLLR